VPGCRKVLPIQHSGYFTCTLATSKGWPCWQVVMMSGWNCPVTDTEEPTGTVEVSTPKRLAITLPLVSCRIRQPDSTPSARVPVRTVAVPLAPEDSLRVVAGPGVAGGFEAEGLDEPTAASEEDGAEVDWPDDPDDGLVGAEEPHAATPKASTGRHPIITAPWTVRWARLVDFGNFFTG
jgi:hypothetical protein